MDKVMVIASAGLISSSAIDKSLIGHKAPGQPFVNDVADVRMSVTNPIDGIIEFYDNGTITPPLSKLKRYTEDEMCQIIADDPEHWGDVE